jgi:DNA-binding response OmpR family regulator
VAALLLGGEDTDRPLLRSIFRRYGWELVEATGVVDGLSCLKGRAVQVVIASAEFDWRRVLGRLLDMPRPPRLIVTSRLADETLWAEVLNLGGFDVLAQPFDGEEVSRVLAAAFRAEPARARTSAG